MSLREHSYSVLLISTADGLNSYMNSLLPKSNYSPVILASSIAEAKRQLLERQFDLIIVNSPLPDDIGIRFALDAAESNSSVVLLLIKSELYTEISSKTIIRGVFTIPKPTSKPVLAQALEWLIAARERIRKLENKSLTVEEKMEEIRLVNRAKWLLIERLKMTEPDAHRYIEKQAMDMCVAKREIAKTIIKTYS